MVTRKPKGGNPMAREPSPPPSRPGHPTYLPDISKAISSECERCRGASGAQEASEPSECLTLHPPALGAPPPGVEIEGRSCLYPPGSIWLRYSARHSYTRPRPPPFSQGVDASRPRLVSHCVRVGSPRR